LKTELEVLASSKGMQIIHSLCFIHSIRYNNNSKQAWERALLKATEDIDLAVKYINNILNIARSYCQNGSNFARITKPT
jgi:hypothetical protein